MLYGKGFKYIACLFYINYFNLLLLEIFLDRIIVIGIQLYKRFFKQKYLSKKIHMECLQV